MAVTSPQQIKPPWRADERWLQRTLSQLSTQLASVRDRAFDHSPSPTPEKPLF